MQTSAPERLEFADLDPYLLLKNGNYLYKVPFRDDREDPEALNGASEWQKGRPRGPKGAPRRPRCPPSRLCERKPDLAKTLPSYFDCSKVKVFGSLGVPAWS